MSTGTEFNGRRIPIWCILLLFVSAPLFAQEAIESRLGFFGQPLDGPLTDGRVHIFAVMADFQPDENRFTSGNGTFDIPYLNRDDIVIDPLPHDRGYFEAHLEFAKNYFEQASNGKIEITYTVLPQVFTLPNEMKAYSPTGPDNSENHKLGLLVHDTWAKVAQADLSNLEIPEADRIMFVIFHAGAGRDIELTGTTLDNTPQDIPSVYLSQEAIGRLIGDPDFSGYPLVPGLWVTNSAILPQTQSRRGEDVTGAEFVLQLSINGILTASIGSFLGIPDLFNTENGRSGIGRFGLMDGAGIFSYYGLFPPLPSAWERIYMGWEQPFDILLDPDQPIELPAVSTDGDGAVARHRISRDEYFLVENRHRDPDGGGLTLTIRKPDGTIEDVHISAEEERFDPFDQRKYKEILPPGVLMNVSNFDWSLPGGLDAGDDREVGTDDDRLLNGGILIWHIDEAVIRSKIGSNKINNNPDRPGVSLKEADGVQDIGRPPLLFTNYASGHAFDFWWSGNNFTVITATGQRIVLYQNRFADDTYPNNRSHTGSIGFFEFFDFSDNLPVASFRAKSANPGMADLVFEAHLDGNFDYTSSLATSWPLGIGRFEKGDDSFAVIPSASSIFLIKHDANDVPDDAHIIELPGQSDIQPYTAGPLVTARQFGSNIRVEAWDWNSATESFGSLWVSNVSGQISGKLSSTDGQWLDMDGTPFRFNLQNGEVQNLNESHQRSATIGGDHFTITGNVLKWNSGREVQLPTVAGQARRYGAIMKPGPTEPVAALLITENALEIIYQDQQASDYLLYDGGAITWPAIADFDRNGLLDFIFINKQRNRIEGLNQNGAQLWYFPKDAPKGISYMGTPLLADLTGDGNPELIVASADSLSITVRAYNSQFDLLPGFPLYVGSLSDDGGTTVSMQFKNRKLYAVSSVGDLKVWEFGESATVFWSGTYGNDPRGNVVGVSDLQDTFMPDFGLLNAEETYNWPNPASSETWLRFQTNGEADIDISIITMNGSRLYERRAHSRGGVPQEIRIDTSSWNNGVYYARVKATRNGASETKLIKIAVMH